jgi:transposase
MKKCPKTIQELENNDLMVMLATPNNIDIVRCKFEALEDCLTEKGRRLWAATEAMSYGRGGIHLICKATGISNATVQKGIREIKHPTLSTRKRVRHIGGGRKKATRTKRGLRKTLKNLIESTTKGDPESPLLWTSKSVRNIKVELDKQGYKISHATVATLLHEYGYSLQINKKSLEKTTHADRDAQFHFINNSVIGLQKCIQPVISVDTKKKENLGNFKNKCQELCAKGKPIEVNCHDFPDKKLGKVLALWNL